MSYTLRPYQQGAVDAVLNWVRRETSPCLVDAATGAGKSLIIAKIAETIHQMSGKRILCLAPSAELVSQNSEKYLAAGLPASIYSASAGGKSLRHPVVFGSPLTVKNRISAFKHEGRNGYAAVIIDEAHGITKTIKAIIAAMREANPNLRVIGLSATPYRLGSGYIYAQRVDGSAVDEAQTRDPYFEKLVYHIGAKDLIADGYLTPPMLGDIDATGYDTSQLVPNRMGKFSKDAVDAAYIGHGRKTALIVGDVVAKSAGKNGVLIFAATIAHAKEVFASLPPEISAMVDGGTPKPERERILADFKSQRIKYVVNVAVLTTGFDAPHIDVVAILRKTESVGLLQQIIGRGLRLHPGKDHCLILDYTTNITDHCPDGDLFTPIVVSGRKSGEATMIEAECPECANVNEFSRRIDVPEDMAHDVNGYALDAFGSRINTENGHMPIHYGRRCFGRVKIGLEYIRCGYRWTFKPCPQCDHENDIAARYCKACMAEIIDPNEKLVMNFKALKRDPTRRQCDAVIDMVSNESVSMKGNKTLRVEFRTEFRQFTVWFSPDAPHPRARAYYSRFMEATHNRAKKPKTVAYLKDPDSGFYRIIGYDFPPDVEPEQKGLF